METKSKINIKTTIKLTVKSAKFLIWPIIIGITILASSCAWATTWNIATGYSGSSNPNGAWAFGWKSTATATAFGLLTVSWDSGGGWYKAGTTGDPSMQTGPLLWANANANGLPCIRWTCPKTDFYDINGSFAGADSRGENDYVYVTINGLITFSNTLVNYQQVAPFTNKVVLLHQGDFVDFTIAWDGSGIAGAANWTSLAAVISTHPDAATATANVVNGFVVGANITDNGLGYTNIPIVRFIGGGGSGALATAVVSNGIVTGVTINNPGSGYTNTPIVVIAPPYNFNPVLSIAPMSFLSFSNLTIGGNYQLQQLEQSYYWSNQPVSFTATNANFTNIVSGIASSGDYRLALTPVPTQAFATAQVVNGFVVGVTLTSGGSGYLTIPAVNFSGGGSNATAVAAISSVGVVTNLTLTSPGSGYASNTIVEIDPPPAVSVSPAVFPMMQINSIGLSPYDNYQVQSTATPATGTPWSNWNGGLFTPTDVTNTQVLFITNNVGFFRLQYLP